MPPVAITVAVPGATGRPGSTPGVRTSALSTQAARLGVAGARGVERPHREAVDVRAVEAGHVDRRDDVVGEHAAAGLAKRHALLAKRRQRQVAMEAGDRLVAVDDLEELLLARRAPGGRQQPAAVIHRRHPAPFPARTARP